MGNKVRVFLDSVIDRDGQVLKEIKKEVMGEIIGYWNELYLPEKDTSGYGIQKGDLLRVFVRNVIQHGVGRKA